jgi:hypothetical protein
VPRSSQQPLQLLALQDDLAAPHEGAAKTRKKTRVAATAYSARIFIGAISTNRPA